MGGYYTSLTRYIVCTLCTYVYVYACMRLPVFFSSLYVSHDFLFLFKSFFFIISVFSST